MKKCFGQKLFKVKPMLLSYGPLETIQLLFKTFSPKPPWFRVTSMSQVKWDILYIYIYILTNAVEIPVIHYSTYFYVSSLFKC